MSEDTPKDDSKIQEAVAERLAFFFSDANVRADSFLRRELMKQENKGFVDIETLLKFNSIKQHTSDIAVVAAAAKTLSETLKLSEDEKSIARVTPFTMKMMDDNIPLSLVISNIPILEKENKYPPETMNTIRTLFEPYGKVTLVKLRFKRAEADAGAGGEKKTTSAAGQAFVEFLTNDEMCKAAEDTLTQKDGETVEPKKKLQIGEATLHVQTLKEWLDAKKNKNKKKKQQESKKREREEDEESKDVVFEEFKIDWKKGCVIQVKGLAQDCDREAIRDAIMKGLGITSEEDFKNAGIYLDFSRGQTEGAIRFNEPSESIGVLACKLTNGEVEIKGAKVESASIVEGDEEAKYWEKFIEFKNKQLKHRAELKASKKKSRHH